MHLTRRQFLNRSSAGLSLVSLSGGLVPSLLAKASAAEGLHENRILVVIELTGGNDGLNTVIPFADAAYHRARPELAVREGAHRLNDQFALHPEMPQIARLFKDGKAAIVHGVGYPKPNRSHFRSMEIWHTADPESTTAEHGWLGRFLDKTAGDDAPRLSGIAFGDRLPQSLSAERANIPAVRNFESYGVFVEGEEFDVAAKRRAIEQMAAPDKQSKQTDSTLNFLKRQATNTYMGAKQLREATSGFQPRGEFEERFGQQLRMALQVIAADLGTRVIHVALDGFDTHANQPFMHPRLLGQLSRGVSQFLGDLKETGRADDVLVMTYSEFGRRVRENGSHGTDHGAAAPMFLFGNKIQGGFHGTPPSLDELDDGDLKFTTDFRSVYATVLDDWFGTNAEDILGETFPKLKLVAKSE